MKTINSGEGNNNLAVINDYNEGNSTIRLKMENGLVLIELSSLGGTIGKTPADFLKLPATIKLISQIENAHWLQSTINENQKGSDGSLFWAHTRLALGYAKWLNPGFEKIVENYIKCYLIDFLAERHLTCCHLSDDERAHMKKQIIEAYHNNERLNTTEKLLLRAFVAYRKNHKTDLHITKTDMQKMFGHKSKQTTQNRYFESVNL